MREREKWKNKITDTRKIKGKMNRKMGLYSIYYKQLYWGRRRAVRKEEFFI